MLCFYCQNRRQLLWIPPPVFNVSNRKHPENQRRGSVTMDALKKAVPLLTTVVIIGLAAAVIYFE
jgi:hypothetical protein